MAGSDNKIQLDLEISQDSVTNSFGVIDKRSKKSAEESAQYFKFAFATQGKELSENLAKNFKDALPDKTEIIPQKAGFRAVQSLTDIYAGLQLVKQGFEAVKQVGEQLFNQVLEGDKILKTERRFEALGAQVGIVGDIFAGQLSKSVKGYVDTTDLLELSSEAFIKLGENARVLPRALELARKTYAVFGGSVVDNTNRIISAAETGNVRTLKDIGLYTNLDAAVKAYARQLGTIPALLTAQQVEQARLNAILTTGEQKFKALEIQPSVSGSFTKLKVAIKDLNDEIAKTATEQTGGFFKGLLDFATGITAGISRGIVAKRDPKTLQDVQAIREQVEAYQKILDSLSKSEIDNDRRTILEQLIAKDKARIADFEEIRRKLAATEKPTKLTPEADPAAIEAALKARQALNAKLQELNNAQNQSEVTLAQERFQRLQNLTNLEALSQAQRLQQEQAYEQQKAALERFYTENGIRDEELRNKGREALMQTHLNKLISLQENYLQQRKQITNEEAANVLTLADAANEALAGVAQGLKFQTTNMKLSLQELGKSFVTTFKSQATNAIFAFAQGTKTAGEAAQGLFTGILNAMGEMLISQGLGFILQGAAFTFAGLPNGGALAAAGAAMVAFGATIAAVSAANGGAVKSNTDGGGGGSAGTTYANEGGNADVNKPIADTTPTAPKAVVNINVERFVDRKNEGLWIADLLQERFDQDGIIVRGG